MKTRQARSASRTSPMQSAKDAYESVMADVGANYPKYDAIDRADDQGCVRARLHATKAARPASPASSTRRRTSAAGRTQGRRQPRPIPTTTACRTTWERRHKLNPDDPRRRRPRQPWRWLHESRTLPQWPGGIQGEAGWRRWRRGCRRPVVGIKLMSLVPARRHRRDRCGPALGRLEFDVSADVLGRMAMPGRPVLLPLVGEAAADRSLVDHIDFG